MFNLSNNAVPPVQFASDLDRMLSLLASVADPKASAERLQELNTAVQEAQVVIDGAAAVKAEIDLARGAVEQDKIDASKRLADERSAFASECEERLLGVALREGEAKAALAEAQASRDEAAKIEKEIRGRLDRLNKAAAA
jgi:hypothetical protein